MILACECVGMDRVSLLVMVGSRVCSTAKALGWEAKIIKIHGIEMT